MIASTLEPAHELATRSHSAAQPRLPLLARLARAARLVLFGSLAVTTGVASLGTWEAESRAAQQGVAAPAWGIDQIRLHSSAGGHLLDLRYRVVDPVKAAPLLAADATRYVVEPRTGIRLDVPETPKAGRLTSSGPPEAGRTYFTLFSNSGRWIRPGDRVAVAIGELTVTALRVD